MCTCFDIPPDGNYTCAQQVTDPPVCNLDRLSSQLPHLPRNMVVQTPDEGGLTVPDEQLLLIPSCVTLQLSCVAYPFPSRQRMLNTLCVRQHTHGWYAFNTTLVHWAGQLQPQLLRPVGVQLPWAGVLRHQLRPLHQVR